MKSDQLNLYVNMLKKKDAKYMNTNWRPNLDALGLKLSLIGSTIPLVYNEQQTYFGMLEMISIFKFSTRQSLLKHQLEKKLNKASLPE